MFSLQDQMQNGIFRKINLHIMELIDLYRWAIIEEPLLFVQREDSALPTSSRSLRPRARITYKEHTSEEEEEESEDEARPQPISAHYLRGPPTGPRSKQVWLHLSHIYLLR